MAAVLRVKRRYEDEPLTALVISCKRQKTTENNEAEGPAAATPLSTVVKFAGTVKNQEEDVVEHLVKNFKKDELRSHFKQHPVDVLSKSRQKAKETSMENRYKVINCCRSLDTSNVKEFEDKVMTVIDVEDSVSCAATQDSTNVKDEDYVYDLYYVQTKDDMFDDNHMVSVHSLDQELVFDTYRDNGHSEHEGESEDSNSESNWRNDYPDSDHSERSIDDDDMRDAVRNLKLENESDLSSEDDFVYAVDEKDVERYGYKYAKYKARIKEELDEEDSNSSHSDARISEDESDRSSNMEN